MGQALAERLSLGLAAAAAVRATQPHLAGGASSTELWPGLVLSFAEIPSPSEQNWRARRIAETLAGRAAARHALQRAGHVGFAELKTTAQGGAGFPAGFSGSITHTKGLAAALASCGPGPLGIDLERADGVHRQALGVFCSRGQLAHLESVDGTGRATLIFSAKEAVFKALSPLSCPETIREIEIRCGDTSEASGMFLGWHQQEPDLVLSGFFAESAGLILTVALPKMLSCI